MRVALGYLLLGFFLCFIIYNTIIMLLYLCRNIYLMLRWLIYNCRRTKLKKEVSDMIEKLRKAILEMNLKDSKDWFSPDALEKDEKSWFEPEIIANEYGGTNVVFVKKRPEIEVDNSNDSEVEVKPIDSSPNSNEIEEKKANN